jgi:large subunit ribosomal protein L10
VVKNSLTKKVFQKLKLDEVAKLIDGGVGLSLAGDDIITPCKVLAKFSKDHKCLAIKAAIFDGKLVGPERVTNIANLPPREALIAQVVTGIKSPITGFVLTLGGILRKFVWCIDAIKRKKESQG